MIISLIFQLSSLFNYFLSAFVIWLLIFFGNFEIVAESFLLMSLIAVFTHGLSGNLRNIYLGSKKKIILKKIIQFRILYGIIIFFICNFILFTFLKTANPIFHSSLILLLITNWILELFIAKKEKENRLNRNFVVFQFLLFAFIPFFIFYKKLTLVSLFILIYSLFYLFKIQKDYLREIKLTNLIIKKDVQLAYLSTFFKYFANFAWRAFAIMLIGKTQSSILFAGFSLGSLFVTIFDISYGALWFKKVINKKLFINFFFTIYVLFCVGVLLYFYFFSKFTYDQFVLFNKTSILSLLGAIFLIYAFKKRQSFYEIPSKRISCYLLDIIIYMFNFIIIPLMYYFGEVYLSFSYLISSILCYILYTYFFNYANQYKKLT
jgi:hypothetical protein